jgi:predicted dithiol-disulfide oxidoreductase (DUF899 family)
LAEKHKMSTQTDVSDGKAQTLANPVVSREEWLKARKALLTKEKEFLKQQDRLTAECRELPWVKVDKQYIFDSPEGKQTLADLFKGRSQLIVFHFMLGPGWGEGCIGCSFGADHIDGIVVHLEHHDVKFVAVSRASLAEIEAFKKRMGWHFDWVSSFGNDFNFDYHVSFTRDQMAEGKGYFNYDMRDISSDEMNGTSMFYKSDTGEVYHTYSVYARGSEMLGGAYGYLDHLPKGRNENGPTYSLADWVRHHDKYD